MTIIYTDAGTRFINEKECVNISHNEESRCVDIWLPGKHKLPYFKIEGVERVRCVSDEHDFVFDSSADDIAELKKKLENATFRGNKLSECSTILRNFCIDNLLKVVREDGCDILDMVENQWNDVCDKLRKRMEEIAEREEG